MYWVFQADETNTVLTIPKFKISINTNIGRIENKILNFNFSKLMIGKRIEKKLKTIIP
jgi:hypothetical protein